MGDQALGSREGLGSVLALWENGLESLALPFRGQEAPLCIRALLMGLGGQLGDLGSGLSSAPNQPCAWSTSWLFLRPHFLNHTNTGTLWWPRSSIAQMAWQGMVLSSQKVMVPGARPLGVGVPAL